MNGKEIRAYIDYKSPYAWLCYLELSEQAARLGLPVSWRPWTLDISDTYDLPERRSRRQQHKVKYLYKHVRRLAHAQGRQLVIKGPLKVFDSTVAAIGGLFAQNHGVFDPYSRACFERFFRRELDVADPGAIAGVLGEVGAPAAEFAAYVQGAGRTEFLQQMKAADDEGVFGIPFMLCDGEPFWGNECIPLVVAASVGL